MKRFECRCGKRVFFENTQCLGCQRHLGFDSASLQMVALDEHGDQYADDSGNAYKRCRNHVDFQNCNWLCDAGDADEYCLSCRLNRTIPDLSQPQNQQHWHTLEKAKRRLLYTLLSLGLPIISKVRGWPAGLAFDFMEDQRSNPAVADEFVHTGHADGVITINIAEADDVYRVRMRVLMAEMYRTVLGHFRHESGHYYFNLLIDDGAIDGFRDLFGDERSPYAEALSAYYNGGPTPDWEARYISAYAASHPFEDWAETWAHYLLIADGVETAAAEGFFEPTRDLDDAIGQWMDIVVKLNQINRGLGLQDPYPFVVNDHITRKLLFIGDQVKLKTPYLNPV